MVMRSQERQILWLPTFSHKQTCSRSHKMGWWVGGGGGAEADPGFQ